MRLTKLNQLAKKDYLQISVFFIGGNEARDVLQRKAIKKVINKVVREMTD